MRGSDRSMRRDIDDIALSNHLSGSRHFSTPNVQQPLTGYGRKDMDDMVRIVVDSWYGGVVKYFAICVSWSNMVKVIENFWN